MSSLDAVKQTLADFFGEMKDVGAIAYAFLDFIGGFISYLGVAGFFLFLISLVLLFLTNAVSPLEKIWNYGLVCFFVAMTYLFNAEAEKALQTAVRFLSIMSIPVLLTYGIQFMLKFIKQQWRKGSPSERLDRIEALAAKISEEAKQ